MKRFMRSIVTVALVFLVVAISQSVAAGRPQAVSIEGVATQGSFDEGPPATGTNFGTWTASGSFSDSGTYVENFQLFFRPDGQIAYVVATLLMTGSSISSGSLPRTRETRSRTSLAASSGLRLRRNLTVI